MDLTDVRWDAILRRAPAADDPFLYAVTTTGVYCRPTCPSRRPRRGNVRLFDSPALAEAAGFRPCKRCSPSAEDPNAGRAEVVANACRVLEDEGGDVDLVGLAATVGMSPFHLHRVFKAATGLTPKAYAEAHRSRRVRDGLEAGAAVADAAYDAGFGSSGQFYATADRRLGMTPGRYRDGGPGEVIRFAVGTCSLGSVLAAATDRGVCAIVLGEDPDELVHWLEDRFPKARLVGDDPAFASVVARVVALVERPADPIDLPLDIRGTAFQQRVWEALRKVPAGTTVSYQQLATSIGAPTSTRAVAGACAANAIAVAIPCHRVVRTDGSLSGYRWGVDRKRALLEREGRPGPAGATTA